MADLYVTLVEVVVNQWKNTINIGFFFLACYLVFGWCMHIARTQTQLVGIRHIVYLGQGVGGACG